MQSQELNYALHHLSLLTRISIHIMYPHTFTGTLLTFVEDRAGLEDTGPRNWSPLREASACVYLSLSLGRRNPGSKWLGSQQVWNRNSGRWAFMRVKVLTYTSCSDTLREIYGFL